MNLPAAPSIDSLAAKPVEDQVKILAKTVDELHAEKKLDEAWSLIVNSRRLFGAIPLHLIMKLLRIAIRTGRHQDAAYECIGVACDAIRSKNWNLALEAVFSGLTIDQDGSAEIAANPELALGISQLYEYTAASVLPESTKPPEITAGRKNRESASPLRVAMVVPNLVDNIVAYTRRVLYFARYLDPAKYKLRVFVSENMSARENYVFPYGCIGHTSETSGQATIAELRAHQVPVYISSRTSGFVESAANLARQLTNARIDIAIFQGNMICPIDWLACRWSAIPVKCAIHNGTPMMTPGMDLVFVDNPSNIEREGEVWLDGAGKRVVLRKGADIEELDNNPPIPKTAFGIPGNAVVIGTLSNHLETRMSEQYMDVLAGILAAHPETHLLALGSAPIQKKTEFFKNRGVNDRVHFGGKQKTPGAALKTLDIYAGEFPSGGSQSVIEALACGLPVAALRWGDTHHESVSAAVVGEEYAIPGRDIEAYRRLIESWITNPELRFKAGKAMRRRAEQMFSARSYVNNLITQAESILYS